MKQTAFHDINLEYGAQMRDMFGFLLPWEYAPGHVAEHTATRRRATLCDLDYMGEYTIEGPDALAFAQKLFTNDFRKQAIGSIKYTAMCDPQGNMIDDGTVWRMADDKFMFISGDETDFDWMKSESDGFDVQLENITGELTTLALQGPMAMQVLKQVVNTDLEAIPYYHFALGLVGDVECLVDGMGYTGEFGYELHFHPRHSRQIWTVLMQAGAAFEMLPLGQAGLESLRQEAGYLLVGNDHDKATNPLEAGIGWTVKFGKDAFNGKVALQELAQSGVSRRLVWFRLRDRAIAAKGDRILSDNREVGVVTSGSYSPTSDQGVAMGYVSPEFAMPGVDFTIEIDGEPHRGTLSVMALYDPGDWLTKRRM